MSNELAMFKPAALPSYVTDFFNSDVGSNIEDRATVPSLTYGGKKWAINLNGDKTVLEKRDSDGDLVPVSVFRVVILGSAARRGRAYYEGAYDPDKPGKPLCWSDDGILPHDGVSEPQATKCDKCPMAAKGSKVTEQGKGVAACSQHRMLAVVPHNDLDFTPLRLKLAITSDYDGKSPELEAQGWFAFSNFVDFLRTKNIKHTGAIVTKMKFDPNTDYPKVIFSPEKWLSPEDLAKVGVLSKAPEVLNLLSGTWSPEGADGKKAPAEQIAPQKKKAAPVDDDEEVVVAPPKKKAAPVDDDDEEVVVAPPKKKAAPPVDDDDEEVVVAPPKKKAAPPVDDDDEEVVVPPKKKKAAPPVDDDDEEVVVPPKKKKAASEPFITPAMEKAASKKKATAVDDDDDATVLPKKTAAQKVAAATKAPAAPPANVEALLGDWDDE